MRSDDESDGTEQQCQPMNASDPIVKFFAFQDDLTCKLFMTLLKL